MKIILMILLSTCLNLGSSEYPRFKRKGLAQTGPPRPLPPQSQFSKKWGKPPQKAPPQKMPPQFGQGRPYQGHPPPTRGNRPPGPPMHAFNMHMGQLQQHPMLNVPKFQQFPQVPKGLPAPMKDFFKAPIQQHHKAQKHPALPGQLIKFPLENNIGPNIIHKHQEKPSFLSSPSIPAALEYDYHIQTNSIPLSANTIKQVGEKGPIHTIPAPNLTPADKPSNYDLRQLQQQERQHHQQQQPHHHHQQQLQELKFQQPDQHQLHHQYQVTEPSEQLPKQVFRDQINQQQQQQQLYNTIQAGHFGNQQHVDQFGNQQQVDPHGAQSYQNAPSMLFGRDNLGVTIQETANHGINIGFVQNDANQSGQEDLLLSNTKHYQVLNSHFSTGQPNLQTQAIQSSYEQQQPQILRHFVQPEAEFLQHYQQENVQTSEEKNLNTEPEYHSFNYDEQAHQAQTKSGQSSGLVTATYSLGSPEEIVKGQNSISRSSSVDPLTQAQIVQSYFDTSSRSGSSNAEPDAQPGGLKTNEEVPNTLYYTSLPSKEAAERLAKLQAAGKVNSSLMQVGTSNRNQKENGNNEMSTIFVPDDGGSDDKEDSKEQSVEYEDYAQDDDSSQASEDNGFGQKDKY